MLDKRHISAFFFVFMRIYILRTLIGTHSSMTGLITSVINDIIDSQSNRADDAQLLIFIKEEINRLYERDYMKLFKNKDNDYLKGAIEI
jgi:hypothetical protein